MKKFFALGVLTTSGLIAFLALTKTSTGATHGDTVLQYELASKNDWVEDEEVALPGGLRHYMFEGDEEIDLQVGYLDGDMLSQLEKEGVDSAVKQMVEGQSLINEMFGQPNAKILDKKVSKSSGFTIMSLKSEQELSGTKYITIEKYYLAPHQTFRAAFRWSAGSDESKRKKALNDFEALKVSLGERQ